MSGSARNGFRTEPLALCNARVARCLGRYAGEVLPRRRAAVTETLLGDCAGRCLHTALFVTFHARVFVIRSRRVAWACIEARPGPEYGFGERAVRNTRNVQTAKVNLNTNKCPKHRPTASTNMSPMLVNS